MASGSSQVPVKEPIVGKSHKYEENDLVSSFFLLLLIASDGEGSRSAWGTSAGAAAIRSDAQPHALNGEGAGSEGEEDTDSSA